LIRFLEGTDEDGLGIPYPCRKNSDTNNIGYLDLKARPSDIDLAYELEGWPEFKKLIQEINARDSFFRSLRCDVWFANVRGHETFPILAVGYITIAFEILEYNCAKNCFNELRNQFLRFAPDVITWPEVTVNFKHIPTSYSEHGINRAWSEDIEIHGFGHSKEEARAAFLKGLAPVKSFLLKESRSYPTQLSRGQKTVS